MEVSRCFCFNQWEGGDCSQRICPSGNAWADIAIGIDVAHQPAVCSNRGSCDDGSGHCKCMEGFNGPSCSRMSCPAQCHNHGRCISMRQFAATLDNGLVSVPYFTYSANWDADAIFGCSCDPEFSGWDCMERVCPVGDDPLTVVGQVDETQLLRCDLSGGVDTPTFTLAFAGAVTEPFAPSISSDLLKALLEALPNIGEVSVGYSSGYTFCSNQYAPALPPSGNVVSVTFITRHGPQPELVVLTASAGSLSGLLDNSIATAAGGVSLTYSTGAGTALALSVVGTKESLPCNGRGACDVALGQCSCFPGFASSDGKGAVGNTGDCGYVTLPVSKCPGFPECSGNGDCSGNPAYVCTCFAGWSDGDCSRRVCPTGPAWFDYPSATDTAHAAAECSNKGWCNRASGICECQAAFEGDACERMSCPGGGERGGSVCSGHGTCQSMAQLALLGTVNGDATPYTYGANPNAPATWDGSAVQGCACDAGWTGFDCSQRTCVLGNDMTLQEWDPSRVDETQALTCVLQSVSTPPPFFVLSFRQAVSAPIPYSATQAQVAAAVQAMETTGGVVTVTFLNGGVSACSGGAGTTMTFAFHTAHGALPPLQVVMALPLADGSWGAGEGWNDASLQFTGGDPGNGYLTPLTFATGGGGGAGFVASGVRAQILIPGTSSSTECSSRGTCNRRTGVCECYPGFGASDSMGGPGPIEDCGWREPFQRRGDDAFPGGGAEEVEGGGGAGLRRRRRDGGREFADRAADDDEFPRERASGRSIRGRDRRAKDGPWANPWETLQGGNGAWQGQDGFPGPRSRQGGPPGDWAGPRDDGWQRVNGGWWRPRLGD